MNAIGIQTQMIKMSHIGVINMLELKLGNRVSRFEELEKMSLEELEDMRDELIPKYNKMIEDRKFGAEMIYGSTQTVQKNKSKCIKNPNTCDSIPPGKCDKDCHGFIYSGKVHYPNDVWNDNFYKHNYLISITAQGIEFRVNADSAQDALDCIMDYCVENKMTGLYDTNPENDEEYITAGNYGYHFTTHNIRIEKV